MCDACMAAKPPPTPPLRADRGSLGLARAVASPAPVELAGCWAPEEALVGVVRALPVWSAKCDWR